MPIVYAVDPAVSFVTSATPNTEIDCLFVKSGTRNANWQAFYVHGKAAALAAITGITFRLKRYGTTASVTGTGVALTNALLTGTIQPRDVGAQLAKSTGAYNNLGTVAITAGTGGPATLVTVGCGAAGPGGWTAPNPDSMHLLEGSAAQSLDLFHSSGTASMVCAVSAEVVE